MRRIHERVSTIVLLLALLAPGVTVGRRITGPGGEGSGRGGGMAELRRRQGQLEILAARPGRREKLPKPEGRVDLAVAPTKRSSRHTLA